MTILYTLTSITPVENLWKASFHFFHEVNCNCSYRLVITLHFKHQHKGEITITYVDTEF